jgi:uncharacterized membrane protein YcaP (DUF421 family)
VAAVLDRRPPAVPDLPAPSLEAIVSGQFHISLLTALTVVVTTICIYLCFVALVRLAGPRSLTSMSSFDFACVVAFGAVLGRTVLLKDPTLMIGLVALVTLFSVQLFVGRLRQIRKVDLLVNRRPVLLVRDGELMQRTMRQVHVVEDEIRQATRQAGLHSLAEVGYAVLERNGNVSIIAADSAVDPWLTADIGTAKAYP